MNPQVIFNVAYNHDTQQIEVICDDRCLPWMHCTDEQLRSGIPDEVLQMSTLYYNICHRLERLESGDTACICPGCNRSPTPSPPPGT